MGTNAYRISKKTFVVIKHLAGCLRRVKSLKNISALHSRRFQHLARAKSPHIVDVWIIEFFINLLHHFVCGAQEFTCASAC